MILAIDVGNTNIVLGLISRDKIHFISRITTQRAQTSDQYAIEIKNILALNNFKESDVTGSIISCVVPAVLNSLKNAVFKIFNVDAMVVNASTPHGLNIIMDYKDQLGSDLIVNSVAALAEYQPPLIIIDMGTATTFSAVDAEKNYVGTSIYPGVSISLDALSSLCAQLPHISLEKPEKIIGKNTIDCMKSGVVAGNAAMIDGMIERFEEELGQKATVVATGGIAGIIVDNCKKDIIYDENLLLKGLYLIYKNNKKC